jgi:hypothetical protein
VSIFQKSNNKGSSRQQINIKGVKDGVLILPNSNYRVVLEASSINFELRSEEEQDALIDTYQSFLNALPCSIQILFRVREMDMDKYLGSFVAKLNNETEAIYRKQIENYSNFVKQLVSSNKILARSFYIVLPFTPYELTDFDTAHEKLKLNCDIVSKGLARLGMRTQKLSSLEVLELFYSFYNPEQAKQQSITDQTLKLLKESYF